MRDSIAPKSTSISGTPTSLPNARATADFPEPGTPTKIIPRRLFASIFTSNIFCCSVFTPDVSCSTLANTSLTFVDPCHYAGRCARAFVLTQPRLDAVQSFQVVQRFLAAIDAKDPSDSSMVTHLRSHSASMSRPTPSTNDIAVCCSAENSLNPRNASTAFNTADSLGFGSFADTCSS